jgi:hypothetical protein
VDADSVPSGRPNHGIVMFFLQIEPAGNARDASLVIEQLGATTAQGVNVAIVQFGDRARLGPPGGNGPVAIELPVGRYAFRRFTVQLGPNSSVTTPLTEDRSVFEVTGGKVNYLGRVNATIAPSTQRVGSYTMRVAVSADSANAVQNVQRYLPKALPADIVSVTVGRP